MPDKIRPSEVSEVLLQQLKGINTSIQFDEVGAVLQVSDGVARIYGLLHAEANELLEFENGVMGVVMNLEEDNVGVALLGEDTGIKEGDPVKRTGRIFSVPIGDAVMGRVLNVRDASPPYGSARTCWGASSTRWAFLWTEEAP